MQKIVIILVSVLFSTGLSVCQEEDFRTWTGINVDGEIIKDLEFQITSEVRLNENSSRYQSTIFDLKISYDATKFLDAGIIYRHSLKYDPEDGYYHGNRFSGFISLRKKINRLRIDYRALYEQEYTKMYTSENGMLPECMHRHKLGLKYNIRKNPITPEISGELFFVTDKNQPDYLGMYRINAGAAYKFNKHWRIKLLYRIQKELNENDPLTSYILSSNIEYSF